MALRLIVLTSVFWMVSEAAGQGQRPIQWLSNAQQGVAQAQRSGLPLLFYVGGSDSRHGDNDLADAQQAAFRDPLVRGIAQERFVAVRLPRSSSTEATLDAMGVKAGAGYVLVVATPDGKHIGTIPPNQVAEAGTLAKQLVVMFRSYRTGIFEQELKPTLEDKTAKAGDVIKALKVIEKLLIIEADATVIALLERSDLTKTTNRQVYDTLATLSTQPAVEALLKASLNDNLAATALKRCTPGGAEALLPALDSQNFGEFYTAYDALVKICKLGKAKSRGFWGGQNERLINEELERVKSAASATAKRWREQYEAYR